jgi:hypothetical protein
VVRKKVMTRVILQNCLSERAAKLKRELLKLLLLSGTLKRVELAAKHEMAVQSDATRTQPEPS